MTLPSRRRFLAFAALAPIAGCSADHTRLALTGGAPQPVSAEELELIVNPLSRPAYFAAREIQQGPLRISRRIFGNDRGLLRDKTIQDIQFSECLFAGLQGFGNDLINVTFDRCQFRGGVLSGTRWINVRLSHCRAEGKFALLGSEGDVTCEDCDFHGTSKSEAGLGHWSDHFGVVGCDQRSTFIRCNLVNFSAAGGKLLRLVDCRIGDLVGMLDAHQGTLQIEKCQSSGDLIDFSGRGNNFAAIRISDSKLGTVKFIGVHGNTLDVAGSKLNLFLGGTRFDKVSLKNSVLGSGETLRGGVEAIGDLTIDSCRFDGRNASLRLCGQPSVAPEPGRGPIAWSRYRTLTLRHTEVPKAELGYLQVGTLTLDHATLNDTDLSHSRIGTLQLNNATFKGDLDLRETTIRRIDNAGLNNAATVVGRLESTPDAPEPEVTEPQKVADTDRS